MGETYNIPDPSVTYPLDISHGSIALMSIGYEILNLVTFVALHVMKVYIKSSI